MRLSITASVLVISISLLDAGSAGAQQFDMDLARTAADKARTAPVDPGTYTVVVSNLLPSQNYTVSVQRQTVPIPAFPVVPIGGVTSRGRSVRVPPLSCPDLRKAYDNLNAAAAEQSVPALAKAVTDAEAGCKDEDPDVVKAATMLLARTAQKLSVSVAAGEQATILVQRDKLAADQAEPKWTLILSTGARGEWLTSYGVAIGKNGDERFFAKPTNPGFVVTRERDIPSAVLIPSVYFSWQSRAADRREWAISPTVGFGVTDSAPSVMGGVMTMFNRNLGFVAGVALYRQKRLSGQYLEAQTLTDNLTKDQLEIDVWRPGLVVGVTLRFDSNPFSGGGDTKKTPQGGTTTGG